MISVIVPVYKAEAYLCRCVDSVLAQTYQDFELILVDDGSPDGCPQICDSYAQKDKRVHVIHQENGGLSAARNAGIDYAFTFESSEWLTFIDSDDWVHKRYLEALLATAEKYDVDISLCEHIRVTEDKLEIANLNLSETLVSTEDYYVHNNTNAVIACAKLYKKHCFESIRYPIGKIHEDEFTTYKILFQYPNVAVIHNTLYYYYYNPNGIMNAAWSLKRLDVIEAYEERLRFMENTPYYVAYEVFVETYIAKLFWALTMMITTNTKAKSIKADLRRRLFEVYQKRVPRLSDNARKRVRKEWIGYLCRWPNRVLIKCFGEDRYKRLKNYK